MKKLLLLLSIITAAACSKDNPGEEENPEQPREELILGEWKLTHRGYEASNSIVYLEPDYRAGYVQPYLTFKPEELLVYFDRYADELALPPNINRYFAGEGTYAFGNAAIIYDLFWPGQSKVRHKYFVKRLTQDELLLRLYYVGSQAWTIGDGRIKYCYHYYRRTGASAADKAMEYNLTTGEKTYPK